MKKPVKVYMGILLAILFFGAVVLFFRPYLTEEEEAKKEPSIKAARQMFELGEDAKIEKLTYKVSEAELTEDYEKIDAYYKERGYVLSPEEFVKEYAKMQGPFGRSKYIFPGDVRFFKVKYSVTNDSNMEADFSPESMSVNSIIDSEIILLDFDAFDVRAISEDGEGEIGFVGTRPKSFYEKEQDRRNRQIYTLSPGETINVEVVGEFYILLYNLYSDKNINDSYDLYLMKDTSSQRIHLGVAGSFGSSGQSYAEIRNIQKMKYESWTNLERKEWMDERIGPSYVKMDILRGYGLEESSEPGQRFVDVIFYNALYLERILDNFQIVEWKDLPAVYIEQGNLQRMAERYQRIYGCQEKELKVLLLDLTYVLNAEQGQEDQTEVNYFYEKSNLCVKIQNKEWIECIAQADDWTVLSNSGNSEETGPINMVSMNVGDVVTVQMAYILPPEIYEQYDALYFLGGDDLGTRDGRTIMITEIALK